jgi:hypothetical protein
MNRRDMLKTVGALAVGTVVPATARGLTEINIEPVYDPMYGLRNTPRFERYKTYARLMQNPEFAAKVNNFVDVMTERVWNKIGFLPPTQYTADGYYRKVVKPVVRDLTVWGDCFLEFLIFNSRPLCIHHDLPPNTMYRIETVKGNLIEFQQNKEGPDYKALIELPLQPIKNSGSDPEYVGRFHPCQIHHLRTMQDHHDVDPLWLKGFYPYGVAAIHFEPRLKNGMVVFGSDEFEQDLHLHFNELHKRINHPWLYRPTNDVWQKSTSITMNDIGSEWKDS